MIAKDGVKISELKPVMRQALIACDRWFLNAGKEFVVTSTASDAIHSAGSWHYFGLAFDVRTRHITPCELSNLVSTLNKELPVYFDIVPESSHLHIEADMSKAVRHEVSLLEIGFI